MSQNRLNDLGMLLIESVKAKKIDFQDMINVFASRKIQKARFQKLFFSFSDFVIYVIVIVINE
jgi:hypothetical protein